MCSPARRPEQKRNKNRAPTRTAHRVTTTGLDGDGARLRWSRRRRAGAWRPRFGLPPVAVAVADAYVTPSLALLVVLDLEDPPSPPGPFFLKKKKAHQPLQHSTVRQQSVLSGLGWRVIAYAHDGCRKIFFPVL